MPVIKTPIVDTNDMIKKLQQLAAKTPSGNADLQIKVNGQNVIVHHVRWNSFGDEIEILTHREQ